LIQRDFAVLSSALEKVVLSMWRSGSSKRGTSGLATPCVLLRRKVYCHEGKTDAEQEKNCPEKKDWYLIWYTKKQGAPAALIWGVGVLIIIDVRGR